MSARASMLPLRAFGIDSPLPPPNPNLLPRPITAHLLPLNFLPRNRQLSPQTLKLPLTQPPKPPIQFLLPRLLNPRNYPNHIPSQP